ncbi:MAG: GtrA family protein [Christensenellales bacterium]|jgi:putative flippase GtrA
MKKTALYAAILPPARAFYKIQRFALSSFACFLLDYTLFAALGAASAPIANIVSRAVSASANYAINKRWVFRHAGGAKQTAARYFALAGAIGLANTFLLAQLTARAGMNRYIAKMITETAFFFINWLMQRHFVFRHRKSG